MVTDMREKQKVADVPRFWDPATMTEEELTDPDYALKKIVEQSGGKITITCSKCHHCR